MVRSRDGEWRRRGKADRRGRRGVPDVLRRGQDTAAPRHDLSGHEGSALPLRLRGNQVDCLAPRATMTEMPPLALLAGGLATRLGPLTKQTPKAMLDIAG